MSCEFHDSAEATIADVEDLNGLYSYAMVLTRNHADAESLVQETYAQAILSTDHPQERANVKGWLFKTLRNAWLIRQLGKSQTNSQVATINLGNPLEGEMIDPNCCQKSSDAYASQGDGEPIRSVIQKLPTEFQEIILLREFEKLSYHEIAGLLDCPAGTVVSRLITARSSLRVLLSSISTRSEPSKGKVRNEGLQ